MDALKIYAGDSEDDSDIEESSTPSNSVEFTKEIGLQTSSFSSKPPATTSTTILPPPPDDLLNFSAASVNGTNGDLFAGRIRSFPHVEGNFALHVYIPIILPSYAKSMVLPLVEKAKKRFPRLQLLEDGVINSHVGDAGIVGKHTWKAEFHISLSRTVAVCIHQIDSIVSMLRKKLSSQRRYLVEFGEWEVFTNDERTRTFLSLENTTAGVFEIQKQVIIVDEVFKLHNLPTFYKNPRPHISLAWAAGDVSNALRTIAGELNVMSSCYENKKVALCLQRAVLQLFGEILAKARLAGIFASLAALMFNCIRREDLEEYSVYDEGEGCRSRTWLFLAYVISFVSLAGAVGMLVEDALVPDKPSTWTGIAGVLQCAFVLGSGLLFWTSRSANDH